MALENYGYNRCEACGAELAPYPVDEKGRNIRRGRAPIYCCSDCANMVARCNQVVRLMDRILAAAASQVRPRALSRFRKRLRIMASEVGS